jgi:hypothetical protein
MLIANQSYEASRWIENTHTHTHTLWSSYFLVLLHCRLLLTIIVMHQCAVYLILSSLIRRSAAAAAAAGTKYTLVASLRRAFFPTVLCAPSWVADLVDLPFAVFTTDSATIKKRFAVDLRKTRETHKMFPAIKKSMQNREVVPLELERKQDSEAQNSRTCHLLLQYWCKK